LKAAVNVKCGGEIFQICTGVETSVNQITTMICERLKEYGYDDIDIEYTDPALGDILTNYSKNEKAKNHLKWFPKVKLNEGLNNTISWFIDGVKK
jgi:UDP-glucose 4-epimerase